MIVRGDGSGDRRRWAEEVGRLARPEGGSTVLAVPSAASARIVLPDHGPSVRSGLRRLAATHGLGGRVGGRVLGAAVAAGVRRPLAEPLPLDPEGGTGLGSWLAGVLGHPIRLGWLVSPPRSTRKPVLLAFDTGGALRAVVKVGVDPLTGDLVRAEARALDHLAGVDTGPLVVPRLLHHGDWAGRPVVVQEALAPLPALRRGALATTDVVEAVAGTGPTETRALGGSPYVADLLDRLRGLDHPGAARVATLLEEQTDATPVRFGAWHGDLNPGNLERDRTRALVWDWERYVQGRPVGFDLLHHELHDRVNRRSTPAVDAARTVWESAVDLLSGITPPAAARSVTACYLAELSARYVGDGQASHGWALARPEEWLVPLLEGDDRRPVAQPGSVRQRAVHATRPVVRRVGRATAALRRPPDFLIVGAQRCGTTSMFKTIAQHPDVVPPLLHKGVHYFDTDHHRGRDWYLGHFPLRARAGTTGESSPYYLFHPLAAGRIAAELPDAKAIVLLRDPVERAYSAHAHELARGFETLPFDAAVAAEGSRLAGEEDRLRRDPTYRSHSHQHHAYVARGRYADQLRRLEAALGRERILVLDADDFFLDPAPVFAAVLGFLGLADADGIRFEQHNSRPRSRMPEDLRAELRQRFEGPDEDLAQWWGQAPSWRR